MNEWLETDGLGGFASGSYDLINRRRYHSLLTTSLKNPLSRVTLVKGCEVSLEVAEKRWPLSGFAYQDGVVHPDPTKSGVSVKFIGGSIPTWIYEIPHLPSIEFSIVVPRGKALSILQWRFLGEPTSKPKLIVRPFLCDNNLHSLQKSVQGPFCVSKADTSSTLFTYINTQRSVYVASSGQFHDSPNWYYSVYYEEEDRRGYDSLEDLYSPGLFEMVLSSKGALISFSDNQKYSIEDIQKIRDGEISRRTKMSPLEFSSEQFLVRRGAGKSIIAGYPWFSDWGRDTFISMRGLCLSLYRLEESLTILDTWGEGIDTGLVPNSFPESDATPIYNSVDASLWYVISSYETLQKIPEETQRDSRVLKIKKNIKEIIQSFIKGTKFNIRMDPDFLLRAGEEGLQITWMDAKINEEVVTPRIGKPVEVQALWINALRAAAVILKDESLVDISKKAEQSFNERFWNSESKSLYDVVDVNHKSGQNDDTVRSNQIFAIGGLPWSVLSIERTKDVLNLIEADLLTPFGLRTLSPTNSAYIGRYEGSQRDRDLAYHQGTVWPWLMGAFVDAWLRVRGYSAQAKVEARERFLLPFLKCMEVNSHLPEIADGDYPHVLRGSPFQAWSLGEFIRISEMCRSDENI